MFKNRRYVKPRVKEAIDTLNHLLDEATVLAQTLVLQRSGTRSDRFKTLDFKRASIDSLNSNLITLKSFIKKNLHFLDETIDNLREECLNNIKQNVEFTRVIIRTMNLNLISDNNDIAIYLAPYIEDWTILSYGVKALILNQIIRNINSEIRRTNVAEKIARNLSGENH